LPPSGFVQSPLPGLLLLLLQDASFLKNPEHRELYLSGLRLAVGDSK
jgi:hypothetical protein